MSSSNFMSNSETNNQDPWLNTIIHDGVKDYGFEDKFILKQTNTFQPLDDSLAYLAALEKKLSKLKKGTKNKEKELLQAVEKTYDSYMFRVISSESREALNVNQDSDLEKSVRSKSINSWINPKQALTVGELAELLKNDSLELNTENPASLT